MRNIDALGVVGTQVKKAAEEAGKSVNEKRARRGLLPRALKAAVVGFPNVGKSALINRLLGRAVAPSAPRPGVTRQLKWSRLGDSLDLLDTPGAHPAPLPPQNRGACARMHIVLYTSLHQHCTMPIT